MVLNLQDNAGAEYKITPLPAFTMMAPSQVAPPWNFNYRRVLLEEVALEGLDGISIKGLWKRLEHRMSLHQLHDKMKEQMWSLLMSYRDRVAFFELPAPAPDVTIHDRFSITDGKGNLMEPMEPLEGSYVYSPVSEMGSCQHYKERKKIQYDMISSLSLQAAIDRWGDYLVVVASAEERWRALSPHLSKNCVDGITPQQYCLLEIVGKSRENGVMTAGKTNLSKIVKDPKLIFYLRKNLQRHKLITAKLFGQSSNGKISSCILLRLLRYTAPKTVTLPRNGMIHKLMTRLREMPEQMECFEGIQKFLQMSFKEMKYFTKRQETMHFFKIVHKPLPPTDKRSKRVRRRFEEFLQLDIRSDESSADEAEEEAESAVGSVGAECRGVYRVGVGIMRQAYEMIGGSGQLGLTMVQLSRMLNIDYNSSRGIIKNLIRTKLIKRTFEEKGKQRIGRYISLASVAETSSEYVIEKEKLLKFLKDIPNKQPYDSSRDTSQNYSLPVHMDWDPSNDVSEVREFENIGPVAPFSQAFTGNEGKLLSFRQLIVGNAIVKAIWEREVVYGTHELNQIIRKDTGLDLRDGKTMKRTLQRLILDNLLHYYRIRWPVKRNHFTILLCAPHITIDHPIVKTNFRDICLKAYRTNNQGDEKTIAKVIPDDLNCMYFYPRYLRARKLHEFLFNVVYVEEIFKGDGLPPGCFNLVNVIPEMTVELALGHTCNKSLELMELASDKKSLQLKIKNAPKNVCIVLLGTLTLVLTIKRNIRTLASFGLVQFCDEYCQQTDGASMINKAVYYLNRNAKLLDTTGKWPEEGRECKWKKFHLGTTADVVNYWTTFYNTSINTIITTPKSEKRPVAPPVSVCKPEEAAERDTGDFVAGDGRGAAGMDSTYHVELPHLWSTAFIAASNPAGIKRKLVDLQKHQSRVQIPRKRRCLARSDPPKSKAVKKKPPKPSKVPTVPTVKPKPSTHPKKRNRIMTHSKWSPLEDKVILWTRVAKNVMSPTSSPGALQIANFLARDLVTRLVEPKTASVCHSRAMSLERLPSVMKVKDRLMTELRRRPEILNKYGGMCRKIRLKHIKQISKYLQEGQLRMAELVWIISKLPVIDTYDQSFPRVASDLREIEERFNVKCTKRDVFQSTERTLEEVQVATIEQGIIQMMNTLLDIKPSMEHSMKIYNVFKDCSEVALTKAIVHLRRTGVVVHKEKSSNVRNLTPKEAVAYSSTFKISAAYKRCWQNIYSTGFPGKVTDALQVIMPSNDVESSSHMACILLELSVAGDVEIILTKKPTVKALGGVSEPDIALVDVDERVSVKLQRGKVGWKLVNSGLSRISDLFDDIALTNEVSCLSSKSLFVPPATHESSGVASEIINFLDEKRELGATFEELLQTSGMTREILQDNLKKLEIKNLIKKVGFSESRIVLWKYIDPWVIMLENDRIIPAPWISMERTLKQSTFIGWCGAVAQKIIDYPGISVSRIAEMCTFLSPKHVEDICNFLLSFDCIKMMRISAKEPDLFSDDDQEIIMDDLYEYASPEYVLVFPVCDSLVRYSLVKKKLSEYKP